MKFNIYIKLIFICLVLLLIPSLIIGIIGYNTAKNSLDELSAIGLKNNVRMAIELIDAMDQQVKKGNLTLNEAQEQVKVRLLGKKQKDGKRPITQESIWGRTVILLFMT